MNANSFLLCMANAGFNTGNSVGLYAFSGFSGPVCFNQLYLSGYNFLSGLPFAPALPLVYSSFDNQLTGNFYSNQFYQIANGYTGDFGILISTNYSGCKNVGNNNFLLISTINSFSNGNSGVYLGITPTNRLFASFSGYSSTISKEIEQNDYIYLGIKENRFINYGLFNVKNNNFYSDFYDFGSSGVVIQNLYIGGALNYPSFTTGYSGKLNEIYLFNDDIRDSHLSSCVDCSFASGHSYYSKVVQYDAVKITGSYWTEIFENQITGLIPVSGNYVLSNGTSGSLYYNSGLTGNIRVYESLVAETGIVSFDISGSGLSILFDTDRRINYTNSILYFDIPILSGDVVEIYTYRTNNPNVNLNIVNNTFPTSSKEIQLFGNGLAETKDVDYSVSFNNLINGFDTNDILMYDLYTGIKTMLYNTDYVLTGGYAIDSLIIITGASGVDFSYPFQYDFYFNGQKMTTGIDYSVTGISNKSKIICSLNSTSGYNYAFFDINRSYDSIVCNGAGSFFLNQTFYVNGSSNGAKKYISANGSYSISKSPVPPYNWKIDSVIGGAAFYTNPSTSLRVPLTNWIVEGVGENPPPTFNTLFNNDLELKFVPIQSGSIKKVYSINNDSYYISGISGFSEQVWINGVRQQLNTDYLRQDECRACAAEYVEPSFNFNLFNIL